MPSYTTGVAPTPGPTTVTAVEGTITAIYITPTSQSRPPHGQIWPRGSKS